MDDPHSLTVMSREHHAHRGWHVPPRCQCHVFFQRHFGMVIPSRDGHTETTLKKDVALARAGRASLDECDARVTLLSASECHTTSKQRSESYFREMYCFMSASSDFVVYCQKLVDHPIRPTTLR